MVHRNEALRAIVDPVFRKVLLFLNDERQLPDHSRRSEYGIDVLRARPGLEGDDHHRAAKQADLTVDIPFLEELGKPAERSKDAAVRIVGEVEVYIEGVVDLEKEKTKLLKQRDQLRKRVDGARKKLENEQFLARAKPEVVARERERRGELEAELRSVEANLETLGEG